MADFNLQQDFDRATYSSYCSDFIQAVANHMDRRAAMFKRGDNIPAIMDEVHDYFLKDAFMGLVHMLMPLPTMREAIEVKREDATIQMADKVLGEMVGDHSSFQTKFYTFPMMHQPSARVYAEQHGLKNMVKFCQP